MLYAPQPLERIDLVTRRWLSWAEAAYDMSCNLCFNVVFINQGYMSVKAPHDLSACGRSVFKFSLWAQGESCDRCAMVCVLARLI